MSTIITKSTWRTWSMQTWVSLFLAASLFAVPLSSTAKSILIVISLGLIISSPAYRRELLQTLSERWCQAAILLFLISILACAWSPATLAEKCIEIEKYSKLLYLPVLVVGFSDAKTRRLGLHAFLLAMTITFVLSFLMFAGIYQINDVEAGGIFRNHIMTGYMMAFAAYLAALLFFQERGSVRILYALLTILFTFHMLFINNGRAGYVIYLLMMVMLLVQMFSWRQALLGTVLGFAFVTVMYYQSPVMQKAVGAAITDCKLYANNEKNTSVGYRLQFHDYAYDLFKRHPWFGNGTASFRHLYHDENPIPARGRILTEPHSQYWLVASEYGMLGCFALVFFFGSLCIASWRLKTLRPVALAILIPFFVGNLSDSLLFYSGTGYFFILFMALCLGEQKRTVS